MNWRGVAAAMDLDARLDAIQQQQASTSAERRRLRDRAELRPAPSAQARPLTQQARSTDQEPRGAPRLAGGRAAQHPHANRSAKRRTPKPPSVRVAILRRPPEQRCRRRPPPSGCRRRRRARRRGGARRLLVERRRLAVGERVEPTADSLKTLEELQAERRLMARLGFNDKAREFDARVQHPAPTRARGSRETRSCCSSGCGRRSQRQRRSKLLVEHEGALASEEARKRDKEELASAQAAECQELIETVTKAAALEDVELPRQLAKYRYRHSKRLLSLKENAERLRGGGRPAQAAPSRRRPRRSRSRRWRGGRRSSRWRSAARRRR